MSFFQACIMYYITELMGIPEEQSIIVMATSIATMIVPSLVVVGAAAGQGVGRKGLLLTAVVGGVFTLISVVIYAMYREKEIRAALQGAGEGAGT